MKSKLKAARTSAPPPEDAFSDIRDLLDSVDFSTTDVVGAAARNPGLFLRAIEFRYACMRKRSAAKMALERQQAETELRLRHDAAAAGEKLTEGNIKALMCVDDDVAEVQRTFAAADEWDEYAKLVVEAFRMRRDCLRIVGDLTREELALTKAVEAGNERLEKTRSRLRDRFPGGE